MKEGILHLAQFPRQVTAIAKNRRTLYGAEFLQNALKAALYLLY